MSSVASFRLRRAVVLCTPVLIGAFLLASCGARTGPGEFQEPDAGPDAEACPPDDAGQRAGDPCDIQNPQGRCQGELVCENQRLVCSARVPALETCNGLDDDCDDAIDEDFSDAQGRLASLEHCGACNHPCTLEFSNAAAVTCDAERETPACIVLECLPGFVEVSDTFCAPEQSLLCAPCVSDEDCAASPGARCVRLIDPNALGGVAWVCAQDCAPDSPFGGCPAGFACASDPEGTGGVPFVDQCLPATGTCSCESAPDGTVLPCVVLGKHELTGEPITCGGQSVCDDGQAGPCELPVETCNGVDDDCNGKIDDPFRDAGTGLYDRDPQHCGFCGNDCRLASFANATSACIGQGLAPYCGPVCLPGFFDADRNEATGCECAFVSTTDHPDPQGVDANCDGIDGEVENAYFVAPTGSDTNPGTREAPFRTVQHGIDRAAADGKRDVLVAQGVYGKNVRLRDRVHTYGGYSQDFARHAPDELDSALFGQALGAGERGTVTADGVTAGATLDGFSIYGIDASALGQSTYAVSIVDCTAALRVGRNRIVGGVGGPGLPGTPGADGEDATDGSPGLAGIATDRSCSVPPLAGGLGGNTLCESTPTSGGNGGQSHCPRTERLESAEPCDATESANCKNTWNGTGAQPPTPPAQGVGLPGDNGGGPGGGPTYDRWTMTNQCFLCNLQLGWPHLGEGGVDGGRGIDGAAGAGCAAASGSATAFGWIGLPGTSGASGTHGRGGGGGSAGSGFDITAGASAGTCQDRLGGSGGGGGGGGCRGLGGSGGQAGGGSFGVWIGFTQRVASAPTLTDNEILVGFGGAGGAGAAAGAGGTGGLGAPGGIAQVSVVFCAEAGGRGGNGGAGGHGGGGGGGCGGMAYGIVVARGTNTFSVSYGTANRFVAGRGGAGGPGGSSLGTPGTTGQSGGSGDVLVL
jgi:hypothetical protein